MLLKRLEIFGFKSFADKTVMNFGPGVTAVVGPNGCGKSNVFDAIRWVLGEQSVKDLRGASMEDVIFNGTEKKPSLGFAEVSLTFSNDSHALPVDYDEVTVTRRLFRSGESEYLLNKTSVRLKDITELFMGTGIGAEAYSLVQQGKVDLVVSAKPEDRRVILDEASGITKYKSKRREALSKLRDTENNLLRINDIITEVKRQISSLERQANKARKFKEEFEKLKDLEVRYAGLELNVFARQSEDISRDMVEKKAREARLSETIKEMTELLENETQFMEELDEKVNELTAESIKMDGQADLQQRQIEFNEERIENVITNQRRIAQQKGQIEERCRAQEEKLTDLRQSLSQLEHVLQQKAEELEVKKSFLNSIVDTIGSARDTIRGEEEKILVITANQVQVRNRLTEVMKEVQGGLARKRRLEMEDTKVTQEKELVDHKFSDICQKTETANQAILDLRGRKETQNGQLKTLREQLRVLEATIDELEKKKLFLISQREFIEKLRVQYQDIPDPVVPGRFITSSAPSQHHTGIIGKVKEVVVSEGERLAQMRTCLGEDCERVYEIICEAKFIELDPQHISARIFELEREIGERTSDREILMNEIGEMQQKAEQLETEIQEQEKILSIFEAQKNDVLEETSKLNEELDLVRLELEEVAGTLVSLKRSEEELTFTLDSLSQELSLCQMRIQECQALVAENAQQRESTTIAIAQIQSAIHSEQEKKQSYNENLNLYKETLESSNKEIARLDQEEADFLAKRRQFESEIVRLQAAVGAIQERKSSLQHVLGDYERQKDDVSRRINSTRTDITAHNSDLEELRNHLHQDQFREQEIIFKMKEIKDRLMQAYKIDFEAYVNCATPPAGQDGSGPEQAMGMDELQEMIGRLRKRCDGFGSVNLVAIEEFEELKQRFEFLTNQQGDLISAKHSLQQTIVKINRQTRQMFMETFTKVSEEFRIYFRMLFGGGEAQLVLMDPENVLESGIEIIARPPGKKLQNISLLSGGEKTLTAIALIFGVFKVNPSPFCVLDEIDAALDESNVGRFSYLLKDFAQIAQFIVITHNKKTIASAKVMYGITMQETGVSKIVSVKFASKESPSPEELQEVPAGV